MPPPPSSDAETSAKALSLAHIRASLVYALVTVTVEKKESRAAITRRRRPTGKRREPASTHTHACTIRRVG